MSRPSQILEAARVQAGMTIEALWLDYFALGGARSLTTLRAYLGGADDGVADYDVLAQALNETFLERGQDHPVPYRDELI